MEQLIEVEMKALASDELRVVNISEDLKFVSHEMIEDELDDL